MAFKRTIIQVPLDDVALFESYSERYNLSFSSTIVMLAKKAIEQENLVRAFPDLLKLASSEVKEQDKETRKEIKQQKLKTKKKSKK